MGNALSAFMKTRLLWPLLLVLLIIGDALLLSGFFFPVERVVRKQNALLAGDPILASYLNDGFVVRYHKQWSVSSGSFLQGPFRPESGA